MCYIGGLLDWNNVNWLGLCVFLWSRQTKGGGQRSVNRVGSALVMPDPSLVPDAVCLWDPLGSRLPLVPLGSRLPLMELLAFFGVYRTNKRTLPLFVFLKID